MPSNVRSGLVWWALIIGVSYVVAFPARYTAEFTDFTESRTTRWHWRSFLVHKIELQIISETDEPVTLVLGDEFPMIEFDLPASGTVVHRSDWYGSWFNVWFKNGDNASGKVTLRYRFPRR